MKIKSSIITTAFTMTLFGSAQAVPTVIDITGSTAGRSTVHGTILTEIGGVTYKWYKKDGSTASASSADGAIYKGTYGGGDVIIRTFWSGSAAGVRDVSNQLQLDNKFLATTVDTVTGGNAQLTGTTADLITAGQLAPASDETKPEFGFSDAKQAATDYQANTLADEESMFVIPFKFVKTADVTGITNITAQQARAHFTKGGETMKALFTGVGTDTDLIYAAGRDFDSGTRITAMAETGAGVFTPVTQYKFTVGDNGTPTNATDDVITGLTFVGDDGYASGGDLAKVLGATGQKVIGYVGISDAATVITNGGVELTYEGVPFSVSNVKNGSYTYWSYYQAGRMALAGPALSLYNTTKTALKNLATAGNGSSIKLTEMNVERQADGATVTPK